NSESLVLGSNRTKPGGPTKTLNAYQTDPSVGCGMTAYGPEPAIRISLPGCAGCPGSVHSSTLPLPLVSSTHGAQPWALTASPVSSQTLVLTQPATGPLPESQSVSSAS